jgi:adenylate cyclase
MNIAPKKSKIIVSSLIISGLGALFLALIFWLGAFESWEWRLEDKLFVSRQPHPDIIIVAIDDQSLGEIGRWPWDREVMAGLVSRISQGQPRVLGLDVNFPEPAPGDEIFAESLNQDYPIVLPTEAVLEMPGRFSRRAPMTALSTLSSIRELSEAVELGITNTPPDPDGIVRRIPVKVVDQSGNFIQAFGAKIADLASPEQAVLPVDEHGRLIINYSGGVNTFKRLPAHELFNEDFDLSIFENKIVLVGATAPDLHDTWFTPIAKSEPMPGIEVHANLVQTILNKDFLKNASPLLTLVLIFVFAFLVCAFSLFLRVRWNIFLPVLLGIGYIVAAVISFEFGYILNIFYPIITLLFVFTSLTIYRYVHEEREKRQVRRAFEFYLSPHVIEEVLKDPKKLSLGGVKKEMTVLFSDIRGFTALSEGLTPEELTRLMNKYLTEMTNIVLEQDGVLDKYIGDALMAFWGAPLPQPHHPERAAHTAIKMIKRLSELNQSNTWPEGRKINIGIGINTGQMVVGNMGADRRFDYTVLGDAVNLGSRVESINKQYGTQIIVSEFTKEKLPDEFATRYLDKVAVKGKKEPVKIFELVGYRDELKKMQKEVIELYEDAFLLYQKKKWDKALEILKKLEKLTPDDLATKNLIERCEYYKKESPPKGWDGTWVMKTK